MPLAEAVGCARRFGDGWRPAGQREEVLFDLLRRASPQEAQAGQRLLAARVSSFKIPRGAYPSLRALSDDGRRLATAGYGDVRLGEVISEFDVLTGTLTSRVRLKPPIDFEIAYLGDTLVAAGVWDPGRFTTGGAWPRFDGGQLTPFPGQPLISRDWPRGTRFLPVSSPPGGFARVSDWTVTFYDPAGDVAGTLDVQPALEEAGYSHLPRVRCVAGPDGAC
jgi:hypothetical protein